MVYPLSQAPLSAHPTQGRYNPASGTPNGTYGLGTVHAYGNIPSALLIAEMRGPSAVAIDRNGSIMFRDTKHLGRWIDVDQNTGLCLVGGRGTRSSNELVDYRTVRWLNHSGVSQYEWSLPSAIPGQIYGLRTCGDVLAINTADGTDCKTWLFDLNNGGVPVSGTYTEFTPYSGTDHYARSLAIKDGLLWIASMVVPENTGGSHGSLRAYDLATGTLVHEFYGHYPNDVDFLINGDVVWVDEHLDRVRAADLTTGVARTLMAGTQTRAEYDTSEQITYNMYKQATRDGSGLCAGAVEYRGLNALYAPNGISVIAENLFAIADTDNSRVIIARARPDSWIPEVTGVIAHFNEPTKVRPIPV